MTAKYLYEIMVYVIAVIISKERSENRLKKILITGNLWEGENIEALLNTSIFSKILNKHSSETMREKS